MEMQAAEIEAYGEWWRLNKNLGGPIPSCSLIPPPSSEYTIENRTGPSWDLLLGNPSLTVDVMKSYLKEFFPYFANRDKSSNKDYFLKLF